MQKQQKAKAFRWADEIKILADEASGFKFYLGSTYDAQNLDQLKAHGVTYILNVSDDVPNHHEDTPGVGLVYKKLGVLDWGNDPGISRVFDEAIEFVKEAMAKGTNVLAHCKHGTNRSPSIVIALAMYLKKAPLSVVWKEIKKDRRHLYLTTDNRKELVAYDKSLRGKASMKLDTYEFVPVDGEDV